MDAVLSTPRRIYADALAGRLGVLTLRELQHLEIAADFDDPEVAAAVLAAARDRRAWERGMDARHDELAAAGAA